MRATRTRIVSVVEWLIAAGVVAGLLAAGSLVVREARDVRAVTSVSAAEVVLSEPPDDVPPRTVSLPMLLLSDGKRVQIGDTLSAVVSRVGMAAQLGSEPAKGERFTRFYSYVGMRFALVFQRKDAGSEPRVAGIYLH
jgi:hypothetical protein